MSINRTVISGNLTRDPELRNTKSGKPVLAFSIAFNERSKDENGNTVEHPNFIDCALFGNRAVNVHPYLKKGTHVTVDGKLRFTQYEVNGEKRQKHEVILDDIDFTSPKN